MSKRSLDPAEATPATKRQRRRIAKESDLVDKSIQRDIGRKVFEDSKSVQERARPYRLLAAQMPLSALTTTWSLGQNRPVDRQHVRKLKGLFQQSGLNRRAPENRLFVLCRREEVAKMMRHLGLEVAPAAEDGRTPSFDDWLTVNDGRPAEVMAGQHRMKALEAYVEQTGAGEAELWWICDFYDRGRLGPKKRSKQAAIDISGVDSADD